MVMTDMSQRDISLADRIARAEKDIVELKGAQFFGRDVTTPKVIQRHNSDGSPTTVDVIGLQEPFLGGFSYLARGYVTFKAKNQTNPWAQVIIEAQINPTNTMPTPNSVSWDTYIDQDSLFTDDGIVRFRVDAGTNNAGTSIGVFTDVDRLWLKFYVYATDEGEITLDYPFISPVDGVGRGTVVPLT